MMKRTIPLLAITASILLLVPACLSFKARPLEVSAPDKALANAEKLYNEGNLTEAMIKCIDLARVNPTQPGLAELQQKIITKLNDERARVAVLKSSTGYRRMDIDAERQKAVPESYGLTRSVYGSTGSLRTPPSPMQSALQKKVTVHLDGVNLDAFIMAIGASEGINIISDSLGSGKTMTLHAENVPLAEIMDYVSRNLGVSFYVGENLIWATPKPSAQPGVPLFTRLYHLRKGISREELEKGDNKIDVVEAIERFIPKETGADLLYNKKAHVLIIKDTKSNLSHIEELIETLDVCPPQVLIEARFMTTTVSDLQELGINWILNSPVTVTKKGILVGNSAVGSPSTQIDSGAKAEFGSFKDQGVNFTYQGLLTEPMFKAVLHALEVSGKARTLTVPKVTTVNNRPATMRIGKDIRYFEEYNVQSVPGPVTSGSGTAIQQYSNILVPVGTPAKEEIGIKLDVTPSVGADLNSVSLHIVPEISDIVEWKEFATAGNGNSSTNTSTNSMGSIVLPIFSRSKIDTEVIVQSGETVVMGGLTKTTENTRKTGIPILSSIPLIGRLFRSDTVDESKENLLIFVTATILSERGENLVPIAEEPPVAAADKPPDGANARP